MVVHGIVFLIFMSMCSLLDYRNTTNFCIFTLYFDMLPSSLISSKRFFVDSMGYSMQNIMSSTNKNGFNFGLSYMYTFYFLFLDLLQWLELLVLC